MKKSNDTIGNRTRDLPAWSAVPQPNALPRAPHYYRGFPKDSRRDQNMERNLKYECICDPRICVIIGVLFHKITVSGKACYKKFGSLYIYIYIYIYIYMTSVKLIRCNKRQQMKFTSEQAVWSRGGRRGTAPHYNLGAR